MATKNSALTDEQKQQQITEQNKELGRRIRSMRVLTGLSQGQVADRAGLGICTVVAIECGKYNVGVRQLTAILDAMGYELVFQPKALSPDHHTA